MSMMYHIGEARIIIELDDGTRIITRASSMEIRVNRSTPQWGDSLFSEDSSMQLQAILTEISTEQVEAHVESKKRINTMRVVRRRRK